MSYERDPYFPGSSQVDDASMAGGYDNGAQGFGSQSGPSQYGSSPGKKQRTESSTLVAVTIKQVSEAKLTTNQKFKIDDKEQSQVTLVGQIVEITTLSTNIAYTIEDGTGKLTVSLYTDMHESESIRELKERDYVRVVGNLRYLEGHTTVVAFQLIPIKDFNELTFHLLEVIHTHLVNTKGSKASSSSSSSSQRSGFSSSQSSHQQQQHHQQQQQHHQQQQQHFGQQQYEGGQETEFNTLQQAIMDVFRESQGDERGVSITVLNERLKPHTPLEIKKAVEFLSSEGHLYSTIDEEHFKLTSQES